MLPQTVNQPKTEEITINEAQSSLLTAVTEETEFKHSLIGKIVNLEEQKPQRSDFNSDWEHEDALVEFHLNHQLGCPWCGGYHAPFGTEGELDDYDSD